MHRYFVTFFYFIIFLTLGVAVISCADNGNPAFLETNLATPNTTLFSSDTFTVQAATIRVDSIPTSNYNKGYVGSYTDGTLGKIEASTFFQLNATNNSSAMQETNLFYDSVVLITKINYFYGDTDAPFQIQVRRITDSSNYYLSHNPNVSFFNSSPAPEADSIMGQYSVHRVNLYKDSLRIKLTDSFGKNLFNLLTSGNPENVTNTQDFMQLICRGLEICNLDTGNQLIIGLNLPQTSLVLYAHNAGYIGPPYYTPHSNVTCSFSVTTNSNLMFNRIVADTNAHTKLTSLWYPLNNRLTSTALKPIPSSATNGCTYVQAGTGYRTLLTFPTVLNLLNTPGESVKILKATLLVTAAQNSSIISISKNEYMPYPKTLQLFPGYDYQLFSLSPYSNSSFGSIGKDNGFVNNDFNPGPYPTEYSFDVTNYIVSIFNTFIQPTPSVVVSPVVDQSALGAISDYFADQSAQNLDRLIIQNQSKYPAYNCSLRINYWLYKATF